MIHLAVNGTLMRGLELNANLLVAGAEFVREDRTEAAYRLFSIEDRHPGMFRVCGGGAEVAVEIWAVPPAGLGQITLGLCALFFGAAHFVFMNLTAPLVPKWLPPTREFWAYATGVGFVAAGAALLTGVQARLAAILLTAMLASFALLVHAPMLLADASSRTNWSEAAINFAIIGVAWVVADSLTPPRR
jgi:uncharacterized membrane protein YphA (DoxX/SURF4 family)